MTYASTTKTEEINYEYFREFKKEIDEFSKKDLGAIVILFSFEKQHEKEIVNEIIDIVDSELFIECLKPEIRTSRHFASSKYNDMTLPQNTENQKVSTSEETFSQSKDSFQKPQIEGKCEGDVLYQKLIEAYEEHRIDEAYRLKNEYIKMDYPLSFDQKERLNTIELEYNTMISFYKQFDQDGWVFDKEDNGVTLEYKLFEEEKQIAIRIESEFDVSVDNFLAILTEIDLMGNYIPFTYDTKELKVISRNEKIGTSKIYIPLLTDRETYFYAAGYDRMKENGSIFVFSKTINEDKIYQKKYGFDVPEKSDYVRLEYIFFIVEYIPLTKTRAKVRLASRIDLKMNFLPQWILNRSARIFAFDYFKNVIKVNKKFKGSAWEKKVKENPEFYRFFKGKVDSYMGK